MNITLLAFKYSLYNMLHISCLISLQIPRWRSSRPQMTLGSEIHPPARLLLRTATGHPSVDLANMTVCCHVPVTAWYNRSSFCTSFLPTGCLFQSKAPQCSHPVRSWYCVLPHRSFGVELYFLINLVRFLHLPVVCMPCAPSALNFLIVWSL